MAAENEYTIQIGIDASPFNKGLQKMKDDIDSLQKLTRQSTNAMGDSFKAAGKTISGMGDDAIKSIKKVQAQTAALVNAAQPLRTIMATIDTRGIDKLDTALKAVGNRFEELQKKAAQGKGIVNDEDADKAADINDEVDKMIKALNILQKTGTATFGDIGKSIDEFVEKVKNAVKEIKGLDTQTGKLDVPAADNASGKGDKGSGKSDDKNGSFSKTAEAVKAVSDSFKTAKEAAELFGGAGEDVANDLQDLIDGLGNVQKLLEVGALLDEESVVNKKLRILLTGEEVVATEAATGAQLGLNAAMAANPIGFILLAVGTLVAAYEVYKHTIGKVSDAEQVRLAAIKATQGAREKAADDIGNEEGELNLLVAALKDESSTREQKEHAVNELRAKFPEYLHGLTVENALTKESGELINKQIGLIQVRARAQAAEELYKDQLKEVIKAKAEETKAEEELDEKRKKIAANGWLGYLQDTVDEEVALQDAQKKLAKETNTATGYFKAASDAQHELTNTMNGSNDKVDDYIQKLGDAADITKMFSAEAKKVPKVPIGILAPQAAPKVVFDTTAYEEEKKKNISLAESAVDEARKGSSQELAARRNLVQVTHDEELKNQNATAEEKRAINAKYHADMEALNIEANSKYYNDRVANEEATVIKLAAIGDKDSKEYVEARKNAAKDAAKAAINEANGNAAVIKKINEQLKVDLLNIDLDRAKSQLERERATINSKLALAVQGSKQEHDAQLELLKNQQATELAQVGLTKEAITSINDQYRRKENDLNKQFFVQNATTYINTQQDLTNAKLAVVKKGSVEELTLKQQSIDRQAFLDKITAYNSIQNADARNAKIKLIDAKALADKKALSQDYIKIDIDRLEAEKELDEKAVDNLKDRSLTEAQLTKLKADKKLAIGKEYAKKELEIYAGGLVAQKTLTEEQLKQLQDPANFKKAAAQGVDIFKFLGIDVSDPEIKKKIEDLLGHVNAAGAEVKYKPINIKNSFFKALGFDPGNKEQGELIDSIVNSVSQAYEAITKAMEEKAQRQVDAIQKVIDATQEQIDQQQGIVDKEKELSDKGLANDLNNQQKKLDDLKAKKEEEIKQRQDAVKKLQEIRKAEAAIQAAGIIANNIQTASSMITTAANIFKGFSYIPFGVGVALAIGVIASMYASFSAIKKSFKAAAEDDAPKMRRGGGFMLNGPSHEEGGIGLYSGGRKLAEYEGDEYLFAINRNSTRKYLPLLKAINEDRLPAMQAILQTGRLPMDDVQQILVTHREAEDINIASSIQLQNQQYGSLKHLRHLPRIEEALNRQKKELTDMGDYIIEREGNRVRKIRKG